VTQRWSGKWALDVEAASHEAAAEQLTLELERQRDIDQQTSLEAGALMQKTSRLQAELNASARQAAIAEEMLEGVSVEGERQGLTLVHYSAQLEPFLTQKHILNTRNTPTTQ